MQNHGLNLTQAQFVVNCGKNLIILDLAFIILCGEMSLSGTDFYVPAENENRVVNMNGILTSENFKKFMENITVDNYSNIKDMESGFKKHLQLISKEIKLGQISVVYIAPKTPQNPEGLRSFQILFIAPEGFEDEPYEKNFGTGEGGTMTLTFNPLPDVEWTEAELKEIDLIGQIFFIVSTKTRLTQKVIEMTGIINSMHRQ